MSTDAAPRDSSLRVVRKKGSEPDEPLKIFCGHCGRTPEPAAGAHASRVCAKCGMGLLLQAPADTAPSPKDPFIVVDGALTICALSRQAEKLLGVSETEAVNRHIADFLVPGDSEEASGTNLATLLAWAARGETPMGNVVVRPANTFGVRYWARVGPCGPPTAALLVLADAR
jgi:PAS domain S-box-containing protein